jgi:ribonuclease P protein component
MAALALAAAPAETRLRRSADVRAVLAERRMAHGDAIVVHIRSRGAAGPARWTVVAGRKVGGAVQRNRAKRRLRSILTSVPLPAGTDVVVVARSAAVDAPFEDLSAEVNRLVQAALARRSRR